VPNVKRSPNTHVVVLYVIPHVAERDVRLILLLKVFQSVAESAPVVVLDARARERTCHERESQFASQRVTAA
jgi:hypothetical protein